MVLREVICETKRALCDISHIDSHYISHVVTVMASCQEAVLAATSHIQTTDTAIYFVCYEDARRATKEYVAEVIKAHEECNATHTEEKEIWKQSIKANDPKDPVVHLLKPYTEWHVCGLIEPWILSSRKSKRH